MVQRTTTLTATEEKAEGSPFLLLCPDRPTVCNSTNKKGFQSTRVQKQTGSPKSSATNRNESSCAELESPQILTHTTLSTSVNARPPGYCLWTSYTSLCSNSLHRLDASPRQAHELWAQLRWTHRLLLQRERGQSLPGGEEARASRRGGIESCETGSFWGAKSKTFTKT